MSEINVPKVGHVKKSYVAGALAVAGAFVAWRYWQAHQAAASAPVLTAPDTLGDDLTPTGGGAPQPSQLGPGATANIPVPLTNADWTQAAVSYLVSVGYDAATAAAVLGKYLGKQPLTPSELVILRAALAGAGNPPVGTFTVIPAQTVLVAATAVPTGMHRLATTALSNTMTWNTVPGAVKYTLYRNIGPVYSGTGNIHVDAPLMKNSKYTYYVTSWNSAGKESAKSPGYIVYTPKK